MLQADFLPIGRAWDRKRDSGRNEPYFDVRSAQKFVRKLEQEALLIALIAAYLHGKTLDGEPYRSIGIPALLALSKRWSLEIMALDALEAQQIFHREELKDWTERRQRLQMQSMVQQSEAQGLKKLFVEHGLHVLPLKGYYMKDMYPKPEQRQMCDLDFLLGEGEMEQARTLMEERGYVTEHFQESHHDNYRKSPFLYVELHRRLLAEDSPYAAGLGNMLRRAVRCPEGEYEVSWSDYYLFLLVHFAKHVEWAGCGPRSVLDVYLFKQAHGDQLDQAYLRQRLSDMGLDGFCRDVEQIAEYWFGPCGEEEALTDTAREMAHEMLGSGVYGTRRQVEDNQLRRYGSKKGSVEQAGLCYLWNCIFLPRKNMQVIYPVLRKHPALLPVCWLVRGGRMVFATPTRSWKNCRSIWRTVQRVKEKESGR